MEHWFVQAVWVCLSRKSVQVFQSRQKTVKADFAIVIVQHVVVQMSPTLEMPFPPKVEMAANTVEQQDGLCCDACVRPRAACRRPCTVNAAITWERKKDARLKAASITAYTSQALCQTMPQQCPRRVSRPSNVLVCLFGWLFVSQSAGICTEHIMRCCCLPTSTRGA